MAGRYTARHSPGLVSRAYFNRYTEDAIDLCDVLSSFSRQGMVSLHELSRVMGLPAIKALGTLATFLAVLIALFGSRLRHWIIPPQLIIALANDEGRPATLYSVDPITNIARRHSNGIWYHVLVHNNTRWNTVTGVHIFLLLVEAPDASGEFKRIWDGYVALGWRHEPNAQPKTIGFPAECDLCYVLNNSSELGVSPLIKGLLPTLRGPLKIAVTLQARGIEADSDLLRLEISWDGEWSDNAAEMKRHLVVTAA